MQNNRPAMDRFLASVERRAFRMAQIANGNTEDALDIVQETMLGLVQRYSQRPEGEWKPLFFRILQSKISDWHRRKKVRNRWLLWLDTRKDPGEERLEPHILDRLRQARRTALDEAATKSVSQRHQWWLGFRAAAFATAAVAIVVTVLYFRLPSQTGLLTNLEDVEILASSDHLDLYAELDFYAWLAAEENDAG
jgi:RNA polymerase sigma-70 factor (ECF subfamily)